MFNEKIIKKARYCRIYLFTLQNNHLLIQIISSLVSNKNWTR